MSCVSKITQAKSHTRLLVILQRVYILGPRTNLTYGEIVMAKAKKKAKKKASKKK